MAQQFATLSKIQFTEGGFSDKKCTKIVFVFGGGSAPNPSGNVHITRTGVRQVSELHGFLDLRCKRFHRNARVQN